MKLSGTKHPLKVVMYIVVLSVLCSAGITPLLAQDRTTLLLLDPTPPRSISGMRSMMNSSLVLSPDGKICVVSINKKIELWDLETRKRKKALPRPKMGSFTAFSYDAKSLAVVCAGKQGMTIELIDSDKGKTHLKLKVPKSKFPVVTIAFSPDGKTLALSFQNGQTPIWDTQTGKLRSSLAPNNFMMSSLAFSPDGHTLALGGNKASLHPGIGGPQFSSDLTSGGIRLWDISSGKERATIKGIGGPVKCVAFSPDGKVIASGSGFEPTPYDHLSTLKLPPGALKLWDSATGKMLLNIQVPKDPPTCIAFSPDGRTIAVGDSFLLGAPGSGFNKVRLWDIKTGKLQASFRTSGKARFRNRVQSFPGFPPNQLVFSSNGETLFALVGSMAKIWSLENPNKKSRYTIDSGSKSESSKPTPKKRKKATPKPADPEKQASAMLQTAKSFKSSNPNAFKRRLKEIIEKHPNTPAAQDAEKLLEKPMK